MSDTTNDKLRTAFIEGSLAALGLSAVTICGVPCAKVGDEWMVVEKESEDHRRGYAILQLAGRCANGSELDGGVRWHAIRTGEYKAICGAEPGRRSAGWSSWRGSQVVTCPRCLKKLAKAVTP